MWLPGCAASSASEAGKIFRIIARGNLVARKTNDSKFLPRKAFIANFSFAAGRGTQVAFTTARVCVLCGRRSKDGRLPRPSRRGRSVPSEGMAAADRKRLGGGSTGVTCRGWVVRWSGPCRRGSETAPCGMAYEAVRGARSCRPQVFDHLPPHQGGTTTKERSSRLSLLRSQKDAPMAWVGDPPRSPKPGRFSFSRPGSF